MESRIIGANAEELGRLVREIRTNQGLTINDFRKLSGIDPATTRRVEGAKGRSSLGTLEALLHGLGYRLDLVLVKEAEADE